MCTVLLRLLIPPTEVYIFWKARVERKPQKVPIQLRAVVDAKPTAFLVRVVEIIRLFGRCDVGNCFRVFVR